MAKERFKLIPSVYLLPERDGKTLLLRRFNTGYEDGKYSLAAGHAEEKETFREALRREIKEEIGIILDIEKVALVHTMHRNCGDHERVDFFFTAKEWQGEIKNMEPSKCDDLSWFPMNQLPSNTIDYIRAAIECWQKGIPYSEFGWPENK
jgi:8-oxo-dGTP diphosphatase